MRASPFVAMILADITAEQRAKRPRRPRHRRRVLVVAVALLVLLAAASRASAAVTATFDDGTDTIHIRVTADGDSARMSRAGDAILVNSAPIANAPTVLGTDLISFESNPQVDSTMIVDLRGGPFAPGQETEGGKSPEIETTQALGDGTDQLRVILPGAGAKLAIGDKGINFDPDEATGVDADIQSLTALESIAIDGGAGVDAITGAAGPGAGTAPVAVPLVLTGCEVVKRPSDPKPLPQPGGKAPSVRVGKLAKAKRGRTSLALTCAGAPCAGRVVLRAKGKAIGSARYALAAGTTAKARIKLNRRGRVLLKKRAKVRAKVRVTVTGGTPVQRAVRLRI